MGLILIALNAELLQLFREWQAALQQAQAAQNDATLKEAQFKGAARLLHGPDATFEYNEKTGLVFKTKTATKSKR